MYNTGLIFSLFQALAIQEQRLFLGLPWWGWLLIILAIALILWLLLSEKPRQAEDKTLEAATRSTELDTAQEPLPETAPGTIDEAEVLAAKRSGLDLEQKAKDLLDESGQVESLEVIETDLDGLPGPEVVQVVETMKAEAEGMSVTKTTETVESLIDGEVVKGVSETLFVDTEDLDVTRVAQEVSTESEHMDMVENLDAFVVDSQGVDVTEVAESAFDERTGIGVLEVSTTAVDEAKGIGSVEGLQAVITPGEETVQEKEEAAEQALDQAVFDEIMEDLGISDEEGQAEGIVPEKAQHLDLPEVEQWTEPQDLTLVEGIGPKINSILHGAGVNTFADLAGMDADKIKDILTEAGLRLADTSTWPMQAKLAAEGKLDELQALQDSLKGGRFA